MDFLIARASNADVLRRFTSDLRLSRLTEVDGALETCIVDNALIIAPGVSSSSVSNSFLFDGHATCGDFALSSSGPNPSRFCLDTLYQVTVHEPSVNNVSGVYFLAKVDLGEGLIDLVCDPLSQYNLFHAESTDFAVYSNNTYFIEAFLKGIGKPTSRSFSVAAHEASLGFGAGTRTALKGVHLTPPDTLVRLCLRENTSKFIELGRLATRSGNAHDQLQETASSLSGAMRAIHNQFNEHDIVYDLTGGFDSRLVLAASFSAGISGQKYFRSDFGKTPDVVIPDAIASECGMSYAPFPQNFDGEEITPLDFARRAVFRHQGHSTIFNYELGRYQVTNVVRIRGGVGEFVRAVYNPKIKNSTRWRMRRTLKALGCGQYHSALHHAGLSGGLQLPSGNKLSLLAFLVSRSLGPRRDFFTATFKKELTRNVYAQLETLLDIGVEESSLLNGLYLIDRSRRHYGFSSQLLNLSRPSFEPLANYDLWRFASQFDRHERADGVPIHQLMSTLSKKLLSFPYASSPFDQSSQGFSVFRDGSLERREPPRIKIKNVRPPKVVQSKDDGFRGVRGHQPYILPLVDEFFELLFSFDPSSEIWEFLSRPRFEELYASDHQLEVFRENALMFMRLLHGLIWCSGTEDHIPISAKI